MNWRRPLLGATAGAPALPLVVLFGLNMVDELDRIAFAALTPEIRDAFHLSDAGIGAIGVSSAVFVMVAALGVGYIADRVRRVRMAAIAALLWGFMAILTGLAPTVALLVAARLLSGLGRLTSEVVHPSLLVDYYPPETHPRIFQIHRMANSVSAIFGVVAGLMGAALGWRWAFVILALPTFALLAALSRLREPRRGESIDPQLAAEAEADRVSVTFGEARRRLFVIRSLRRIWLGMMLVGIGFLPVSQFLSLFFERNYGFGPLGRGFVQLVFGAGIFIGLVLGGRLGTRAVTGGAMARLPTIVGGAFVVLGAGLMLMGIAPWAWLSVVFVFAFSVGGGAFQPPYFSLVGRLAPPMIRSQAYAWSLLSFGFGGILSLPLFRLGENVSYRIAIPLLAVFVLLGGWAFVSASRFVLRDIEQAEDSLAAARRSREARGVGRALLVCRGVEVAYDNVQVLFGVDLEVGEGEIVALMGTNGAGKSTLFNAISGLGDPIGGAIIFAGHDITHADANQTFALGVVQVPGGKAIFPTLTIGEHLRLAGWLYRKDAEYLGQKTNEAFTMFPQLRERHDQLAGDLSGGEQQMLALGMAFIAKPRLLLIDELSLGLGPKIVEQLLVFVRRLAETGTAVILAEQSFNVAVTVAGRAYFLEKGEVCFEGRIDELLDRPDLLRSVFLESAPALNANQTRRVKPQARRRTVVGPPGSLSNTSIILEAIGLVKHFGGIRAVDGVDLVIRQGEILGLIGPNGAGKTTVFDLISAYLTPDEGRIRFEGQDITSWSPDRRSRAGLGRSFQDTRLFPSLTVAENLALSLERHLPIRDHLATALRFPAVQLMEEDVAWTVNDLIELVGLGPFRSKLVAELSTGTRVIVQLAMCIAHEPKMLLLDEPSSGIAQREAEALGPVLRRIQAETGCSLLVIEHDMPLITSISDEIVVLELGRPIARGRPDAIMRDPAVLAAYLGTDGAAAHRSGGEPGGPPIRRRRRNSAPRGGA